MKLVFVSDIHIDGKRGSRLTEYFNKVMDYAVSVGAKAVLSGGDLFDSPYPSNETCSAVRSIIESHAPLMFLAVCGNHDPLYTTAFYRDVPDNMYVFPGDVTKYALDGINIYGVSMKVNRDERDPWEGVRTEGRAVTLSHGSLDGTEFFSLKSATLDQTGAMLSLMGHIHQKREYTLPSGRRAIYGGCLAGRGFDECGTKGFHVIDTDTFDCEFIPSGAPEYNEYFTDISDVADTDGLLKALTEIKVSDTETARAVLTGAVKNPFTIDTEALCKFTPQFTEIKDLSGIDADIFKNANENTLEGEFIRILKAQLEKSADADRQKILDALKAGVVAIRRK